LNFSHVKASKLPTLGESKLLTYTPPMNRRHPSFRRSVLILLVLGIGPLQANTLFACAMTDMVMVDECCCEVRAAHKDCVGSGGDTAVESRQDPCCERSVEVSADLSEREDSPIAKPVQVRSDVDPPQAIIASIDVPTPQQSVVTIVALQPLPMAGRPGSDIYLITRRLRI